MKGLLPHHPDDVAGEIDHGKTVSDEDDGAVVEMLLEVLKQFFFCLHVKGRGGLVEQEYAAGMEDGTGDGDALCLPFGETAALFGTVGVKTFWQLKHEVGHGKMERMTHLLSRGIRIAHQQVVTNAA